MATRRGNLASVPPKTYPEPPDLRDAVQESLDQMTWLGTADNAMKALALKLATEIEQVLDRARQLEECWQMSLEKSDRERLYRLQAHCDATKIIGWLGPQLQGVLRDLGGAAMARNTMKRPDSAGGALESIRNSLPGARPHDNDSGEGKP